MKKQAERRPRYLTAKEILEVPDGEPKTSGLRVLWRVRHAVINGEAPSADDMKLLAEAFGKILKGESASKALRTARRAGRTARISNDAIEFAIAKLDGSKDERAKALVSEKGGRPSAAKSAYYRNISAAEAAAKLTLAVYEERKAQTVFTAKVFELAERAKATNDVLVRAFGKKFVEAVFGPRAARFADSVAQALRNADAKERTRLVAEFRRKFATRNRVR
jgi:hypothetical protein